MHSRKLNVLARPEPGYEPSAAPRHWPQLVFAREDSARSDKLTESPARILIVEDDFIVATEIETAGRGRLHNAVDRDPDLCAGT